MKTMSDGCAIVFGLFILYIWFQLHWPSAISCIGLFFAWVFIPIFFEELTAPSNPQNKEEKNLDSLRNQKPIFQ